MPVGRIRTAISWRCCGCGRTFPGFATRGAAGSATNVGVQILDNTGTPLALDGATFSAATTLNDGPNIIPFQARYYATGAATAGIANADATFKVQYE